MSHDELRRWNHKQRRVFDRYARMYRLKLTPDLVMALAALYAAKHR